MLVKHGDNEFQICPALIKIVCGFFDYCDMWNLPINIINSDELTIEISNEGWPSDNITDYHDMVTREYTKLAHPTIPICDILTNSTRIIVDINYEDKQKD